MASQSDRFSDSDEPLVFRVPPKRIKTLEPEPEDHISKLPNSILLHILTFLPITDAIRTGLLSKRWDHLWSSIPNLVFRFHGDRFQNESEFISFVDRTLILCNSDVIPRFCIAFDYSKNRAQNVDSWIRFAVNHKVEELHLLFHESYIGGFLGDLYKLPRSLYMNGTITNLNVRHCSFKSCVDKICLRSLTRLSISRCCVHDSLMATLLAGCPVLESFELVDCHGFDLVNINSVVLKELVINGYKQWPYGEEEEEEDDDELRIYAPYLQLLVITGHIGSKICRVENLSSLVEMRLSAVWICFVGSYQKTMITDILVHLKHVKKLTLGNFCLQVISFQYYNPLPSPLRICKSLILDANLEKGGLHGLARMLQSCAELGTLTIRLLSSDTVSYLPYDPRYRKNSFWARHCEKYSSCIQHLKMVKITGITPGCSQTELVIEFLQFLLKHAKVLEKLLINAKQYSGHKRAKKGSLFAVAQTLLKIPRSSPFAEIQLS